MHPTLRSSGRQRTDFIVYFDASTGNEYQGKTMSFTINIGFYDDSSHPILRPLSIDIGRVGGLMFVYYLPGTSNRTVAVGSPPGVIARDLPRYRVQNQEQSVPIIQEPIQLERTIEDVEREISERIRERFRNLEYEKPE